jgi:GNAT superfamily N-acetyltransferase
MSDIPLVEAFDSDPYRKWVQEQCGKDLVWVIVEDHEVVAAAVVEGSELSYLVVAAHRRRGGVGRQLIRKAKALASDNRLTVKAASENRAIRKLLKSEDFQQEGTSQGALVEWVHYVWSPT